MMINNCKNLKLLSNTSKKEDKNLNSFTSFQDLYHIPFLKKGGIHIKKKNRGKFTDYCGGKVTNACISRAKASGNPTLVKRATFAANARKWKHQFGGILKGQTGLNLSSIFENTDVEQPEINLPNFNVQSSTPPLRRYIISQMPPVEFPTVQTKQQTSQQIPQQTTTPQSNTEVKISTPKNSAQKIKNFFLSKGLSREAVAGIMGNLYAESGFRTHIYGDKGTSAGIAQWHAGRLSNLKKFGGDKWTDLDTQLNYLWNELNGPYAKTLQALRNAKTVGEASHAFGYGFERFKGFQNPNHGNYIQRAKYANKFYNI